ncbi:MAG: hypothetical protein HQ569_10140 [Actinobacteria bacterium]|nr:hypothetical protein [Actinomycetota bacterium]
MLHHHEWWDGIGYPRGPKGEQSSITSGIIAIVDRAILINYESYNTDK